MDIYLFSAIANVAWYCFTILFLLYKFTSFFSYVYNFILFSGRLFTGFKWVGNKIYGFIMYRRGYSNKVNLEESTSLLASEDNYDTNDEYDYYRKPLFLEKLKHKIWKQKPYVQKEHLYELHVSNFNSIQDLNIEHQKNFKSSKKQVLFDDNININVNNSYMDTSLHGIPSGISYCAKPIVTNKKELLNSNMLFESEFIREHMNPPFALKEEVQQNP